MSKKPIIVFEGIEGSGKTFHLDNISNYLKRKKIPFLKIREPGGSKNSEIIRKLILNNKSSFNKNTNLLLYLSAKSENIELIKKNYKKKIILSDRFTDSTIAYQHYGMGVEYSIINQINKFLLKDIKVNFTFLNTVNDKNMILRLKQRKSLNTYDKFDASFYNKVQRGFINLMKKKKKNSFMIIDSNKPINDNKGIVLRKIDKLI